MPYIKDFLRGELDPLVTDLTDKVFSLHKTEGRDRDGMLNYVITKLLLQSYPSTSYKVYNEIIGVLECCKLEFYRKQVAEYENQKEFENGSVKRS